MPIDVTMPKLTDSMEEGRIVAWHVAVGDRVAEGDVLAEIETDKAVMELESFWSGTVVALSRGDGDVVAVGAVVAQIGEAGATPAGAADPEPAPPESRPPAAPEPVPQPEDAAPPTPSPRSDSHAQAAVPIPGGHPVAERGGRSSPRPPAPVPAPSTEAGGAGAPARRSGVRASPRARQRAAQRGVDLAAVTPSGGDGQVTVEDVEAAARSVPELPAPPAAQPEPAGRADRADEELPPVSFAPGEAEVEEVSFFQQAAIRRVVASKHVVPHFYVTQTVRADSLLRRREQERASSGASLTHFIQHACAAALGAYPEANRSYDRGRWIRWRQVNLGLAVQTDAGLVVAVLGDAGGHDLGWVAEQTRALVARARAGKLTGAERRNPTFTLSNLGAYDVESFAAIINPPSALTLAVGSVAEAPVVEGGRVVPGQVLHLTLSCDHRVVDGVLAARFLAEVKRVLESPGGNPPA